IPVLSSVGARASIIAGAQGDVFGPLKTYADPMLISAELAPETPFEFSLNPNYTYAVYGLLGEVLIGDENSIVREGELGVLADDLSVVVARAAEKRAHFLVIGGPPIENQIVRHGPFVANSVDHMHNIIHDYQMGKFGRIQ
ncbi:MAG: pirin-like C-terminal cupin domain-containing protein, partial [Pseudomonadota bacterium]